jgi:hypothetical protein
MNFAKADRSLVGKSAIHAPHLSASPEGLCVNMRSRVVRSMSRNLSFRSSRPSLPPTREDTSCAAASSLCAASSFSSEGGGCDGSTMVTLGAGFGEGESAARLTEDSAAMYRVSLREMTWVREHQKGVRLMATPFVGLSMKVTSLYLSLATTMVKP